MRNVIKFFVQHHIVGDLLMLSILVFGFVGMSLSRQVESRDVVECRRASAAECEVVVRDDCAMLFP